MMWSALAAALIKRKRTDMLFRSDAQLHLLSAQCALCAGLIFLSIFWQLSSFQTAVSGCVLFRI